MFWWHWLVDPEQKPAMEALKEPSGSTFWDEAEGKDSVTVLRIAALIAKRRGFLIGPVRYWGARIAFLDQSVWIDGGSDDVVTLCADMETGQIFLARYSEFPLIVLEIDARNTDVMKRT